MSVWARHLASDDQMARRWAAGTMLQKHDDITYWWRWFRRHARARMILRRWIPWIDDRRHAWRLTYILNDKN